MTKHAFRRFAALAAGSIALGLAACAEPPKPAVDLVTSSPVAAPASPLFASQAAADALLRNLGQRPDLRQPILVASLVDVNDLNRSSAFGRMTSEQIGARLANNGVPVVEVKLRDNILVQEGRGELALSRNAREIARARNAQAIVVGTYALGARTVFVNLRLLATVDGRVLSAHDYALPMTADVAALLTSDVNAILAIGAGGGDAIVY